MRKEGESGKVENTGGKILYTEWSEGSVPSKQCCHWCWTDQEQNRVQLKGFYLRTGRIIDSVRKINMKRLC